ncbi:uncharacterized protein LOC121256669 [Juglans microcarpa x Juglans regia]|uniref:uncharacterized protein LOC121256669 n=1 Tax=Juglans microcarpa x Juglans regia TaxID=2249226 RepID=UPI001B7DD4B9|nr:uncharacterized protein LOC121256669 [Juglans microcarpa x Juglans regia]XP_041013456.1 uncharacterized protein LOC121256669 [Juglans microcarpa x Juglans regia]
MSSSLGKLPGLLAKEEPDESLPPEPAPEPVSGGTLTIEDLTNTQLASPESSNTASKKLKLDSPAPKNEESKQESPAGTDHELLDVEAQLAEFLLTIRWNTGSILEALLLSETALARKEPAPSEKGSYSEKENPSPAISMLENENVLVYEHAADILWAVREPNGAGDIMMEEAVGDADDYGSNEKTRDSKEEEDAPDHNGANEKKFDRFFGKWRSSFRLRIQ